jgi:hypothetical protein
MSRPLNYTNIPRHWDKIYSSLIGTKDEYDFMMSLSGMSKEANRKFFLYITHSSLSRDKESEIILPQSIAADCLNRSINNIQAMKEMYNRFRREVLDDINGVFEHTTWDWNTGSCRILEEFHLGDRESEYQKIAAPANYWEEKDNLVFLKDGKRATREKLAHIRHDLVSSVPVPANPIAAKIQGVIHANEVKVYSNKLPYVIENVISVVGKIENPKARSLQEKILRNIMKYPKLLLYPSKELKTDRIFAHGHCVNLPKDARIALNGSNWVEADLVSSQLAIISKIWDIPFVRELLVNLLNEQKSVWKYLQGELSISDTELHLVKPLLKEIIYSICFGKSKNNLINDIEKNPDFAFASFSVEKLFSKQLFIELFAARERKIQSIIKSGGDFDAFGVWREIDRSKGKTNESVRSLMARVAQSWELKIMGEAFDVLDSSSKNKIVVFAHDGFTMTTESGFSKEKKAITRAVNTRLKELDIPSELKWDC